MNGVGWKRAMETALERHADAPNVEQVCDVVLELFPQDWVGSRRPLLPLAAAFELGQAMQQVSFLRDTARERGLAPNLSAMQIRAAFSKTLYRRAHYPNVVNQNDLSRTRHPHRNATAAL